MITSIMNSSDHYGIHLSARHPRSVCLQILCKFEIQNTWGLICLAVKWHVSILGGWYRFCLIQRPPIVDERLFSLDMQALGWVICCWRRRGTNGLLHEGTSLPLETEGQQADLMMFDTKAHTSICTPLIQGDPLDMVGNTMVRSCL